jgi:mRNA interferase YafO
MRIFKSAVIMGQMTADELEALAADFKEYKQTGIPADYFGRDVPYNHPNGLPLLREEEVSHLHLAEHPRQWPIHRVQFYRTSDKHLVYCQGFTHHYHFLLMAILEPDAHAQANDRTIMYNLGLMAEKFRSKH